MERECIRSSEMVWNMYNRARGREYDTAAIPHSLRSALRTLSRSMLGESMASRYAQATAELGRVEEEVEAAQKIRTHYQKQALRVEHMQEIDRLVARLNALSLKRVRQNRQNQKQDHRPVHFGSPKSLLDEMDLNSPWICEGQSNPAGWARSIAIAKVQHGTRPKRSITPAAIRNMQVEAQLLKATYEDMQPNMPTPEAMAQVKSASRMAKFNKSTQLKLEELGLIGLPLDEILIYVRNEIINVTADIKSSMHS